MRKSKMLSILVICCFSIAAIFFIVINWRPRLVDELPMPEIPMPPRPAPPTQEPQELPPQLEPQPPPPPAPIIPAPIAPQALPEVIPPMFDSVRDFYNNYAVVSQNGRYGLINKSGAVVLPPDFTRMWDVFHVGDSAFVIANYYYRHGLVNLHGGVILPFEFNWIMIRDNLATVSYGEGASRTDGIFCLYMMEFVIPLGIYNSIILLDYENRAWVSFGLASAPQRHWGLLDMSSGMLLMEMEFDIWRSINDSTMQARKYIDGEWRYGFVDMDGNIIVPFIYDFTRDFLDGFAVVSCSGKLGMVDFAGNYVIPPQFQFIFELLQLQEPQKPRYYAVVYDGLWGVWDIVEGRLVVPHHYIGISGIYDSFVRVIDGRYTFRYGILCIVTDEYTVPMGEMTIYQNMVNGMVNVSTGTWGSDYKVGLLCMRTGNLVADLIYDYISWLPYDGGFRVFRHGSEWERFRTAAGVAHYELVGGLSGVMDFYGNIIIPATYSGIRHFANDLFVVDSNGYNLGIINANEETILPQEFSYIGSHWSGNDEVLIPVNIGAMYVRCNVIPSWTGYAFRGGLWGFIDTRGNLIVSPTHEYDYVRPAINGMAAVMRDELWGFVPIDTINW